MLRSFLFLAGTALATLAGEPLVALVHPSSSIKSLNREKCAQILRGDTTFLDGKRITLVLVKPSSPSLPAVTYGLLNENPQAFMMRIKAAKLRGQNLDPQFLDHPDAVVSAVAANASSIGFLAAKDAKGSGVRILPIAD